MTRYNIIGSWFLPWRVFRCCFGEILCQIAIPFINFFFTLATQLSLSLKFSSIRLCLCINFLGHFPLTHSISSSYLDLNLLFQEVFIYVFQFLFVSLSLFLTSFFRVSVRLLDPVLKIYRYILSFLMLLNLSFYFVFFSHFYPLYFTLCPLQGLPPLPPGKVFQI